MTGLIFFLIGLICGHLSVRLMQEGRCNSAILVLIVMFLALIANSL